jgi:hypothetical protein
MHTKGCTVHGSQIRELSAVAPMVGSPLRRDANAPTPDWPRLADPVRRGFLSVTPLQQVDRAHDGHRGPGLAGKRGGVAAPAGAG